MKTYPITCHVCGTQFDLHAEFVSGLPSTADGRLIGTCNMAPEKLMPHPVEQIAASWRECGEVAAMRER